MVAITMGERSFSKVLFIFLLLGGFFATKTVLGNPLSEDDLQSDDAKAATTPVKVTKQHEIIEVTDGEKVTIPCYIEADPSKHVFFWSYINGTEENVAFLDAKAVWAAGESFLTVIDDHRLVINPVTPQRVGVYKCYLNPETFTLHEVRLKAAKTPVSVDIGHVPKTVDVGDNLHLSCNIKGYPEPRVEWRRKKLSASSSIPELIGLSANVTIPNVSVLDSGEYICWASNSEGEASKSITVKVIKEGLSPENEYVFVNHTNKEASLCCMYSRKNKANPIGLYWTKENKELVLSSNRYETHVHGKSKLCLTIKKVKEEDLGVYDCRTQKSTGQIDKASITLTGAPEKPVLDFVGRDNETNTPVLRWKVKYGLSPITDYQIYTLKQGDDEWKEYANDVILGNDVSGEDIEERFDNLPDGKYQTKLIVRNKQGSAEFRSDDMPLSVDKHKSKTDSGSKDAGTRNYASVCVLVTILVTLLNR